jgi:uncharacterized membrane protein
LRKGYGILAIFILIGLLTGSLVAHLLSSVEAVSFLTETMPISWNPQANLDFLKYDFNIQVKISLLSILGIIAAYWIYRKM